MTKVDFELIFIDPIPRNEVVHVKLVRSEQSLLGTFLQFGKLSGMKLSTTICKDAKRLDT